MNRRLEISVDANLCVSNGECVRNAPGTFRKREVDGLSEPIDPPGDDERTIIDVALMCPTGAISVRDADSGEDLLG